MCAIKKFFLCEQDKDLLTQAALKLKKEYVHIPFYEKNWLDAGDIYWVNLARSRFGALISQADTDAMSHRRGEIMTDLSQLSSEEQEQFFDSLGESLRQPSAVEDKFFEELNKNVSNDDAG